MLVDTIQLSHLLETKEFHSLNYFLNQTAFIIAHKNENIDTLLGVLWYLPINSPIIIVSNCDQNQINEFKSALIENVNQHKNLFFIHQKDERIAEYFAAQGVPQILDENGLVVDGKGEGMYIGTLCAIQLGYPEFVVYYDADNFVPSALLEYTLAMAKLFTTANLTHDNIGPQVKPDLHNIRICWASKPDYTNNFQTPKILGRCTRVVSPLFNDLLLSWFGQSQQSIISSNAGEQGLSIKTAKTLRFSSGYSVETFQLLDFLFHLYQNQSQVGIFQQYQAKSPHFHDKKDDGHIQKMIEQSLGCFFLFEEFLSTQVKQHLQEIYETLNLELQKPTVYPPLKDFKNDQLLFESFRLFESEMIMSVA